jgi:hypothetical protein
MIYINSHNNNKTHTHTYTHTQHTHTVKEKVKELNIPRYKLVMQCVIGTCVCE